MMIGAVFRLEADWDSSFLIRPKFDYKVRPVGQFHEGILNQVMKPLGRSADDSLVRTSKSGKEFLVQWDEGYSSGIHDKSSLSHLGGQ